MATNLKLTRNQLASFLKDAEQIKQFERLILLVNDYLNSGEVAGIADTLGSVIAATNANAAGLQALGDTLDRLPPSHDLAALETRLAALEAAPDVTDTDLANRVSALEVAPVAYPSASMHRYGVFIDTTDQTAAAANTAYAMTFDTTSLSQGVTIGSPTSRIYVDRPEAYNIQFSAQFTNTAGGAHKIWVWLRINGTNVANSTTTIRIEGNNSEAVAAWNFVQELNAGDYFELMWEVSDTAVSLFADPATAVHPAIPSVILTVTDNIQGN